MLLDQIIPKLLERCDPSQEPESELLSEAVDEAEKNLTVNFTEAQKKLFRQYLEAVTNYHCFELEYLEKICFSLGVTMMDEVKQATKHHKKEPV